MKYLLIISTILGMTLLQAEIIMGVVPQQSPIKLMKIWKPITDYLSDTVGEKIIFKTEKSIGAFEDVLYSGGYDIAYMNPYHFVVANKLQGYEAKIRAEKNIRGILVKKKSDKQHKKFDTNSTFLFPSPNAFAATLLNKYDLYHKFSISLSTLNAAKYVNSHDSVYKGISRDIGTVGGGIERTFSSLDDIKTKNKLIVIHTTDAYPSHPFAIKPTMSQSIQKRLTQALLKMPQRYLASLKIKKLKRIDNSEYESIEKLANQLEILPR